MTDLGALEGYLQMRQTERGQAVDRLAETFTDRELRLIKEAAVMGYVQGAMSHPYRETIPHDRDILAQVLDGCLHNADLYPVITGYRGDSDD